MGTLNQVVPETRPVSPAPGDRRNGRRARLAIVAWRRRFLTAGADRPCHGLAAGASLASARFGAAAGSCPPTV
ncbi:MAG: hypothetical protein LBT16_12875 [Treponema sp.]|nr:hypothetical protein [Treponema sp.]